MKYYAYLCSTQLKHNVMNKIPVNSSEFRTLVTKSSFTIEQLYNDFDGEVLVLMGNAVLKLLNVIDIEIKMLSSVEVKAIAMDDFNMAEKNIRMIISSINMKALKLETFCLN